LRPVFFRSDFGAGFASPSEDGVLRSSSNSAPPSRPGPRPVPEALLPAPAARQAPPSGHAVPRSPPHARPAAPAAPHRQHAVRQHHHERQAYPARAADSHNHPRQSNRSTSSQRQKPGTTAHTTGDGRDLSSYAVVITTEIRNKEHARRGLEVLRSSAEVIPARPPHSFLLVSLSCSLRIIRNPLISTPRWPASSGGEIRRLPRMRRGGPGGQRITKGLNR
jgi:hypothetical protein